MDHCLHIKASLENNQKGWKQVACEEKKLTVYLSVFSMDAISSLRAVVGNSESKGYTAEIYVYYTSCAVVLLLL